MPYRGGSEVITDILGARIDFYFCPLATALPLIREGQVRALLVSTSMRVADLPDVPTPQEAGLKDADSAIWFGVFMPSKTPRDIVEKFHAAGVKLLSERQARDRGHHGRDQVRRDQAIGRSSKGAMRLRKARRLAR
jgi:tripartite-type tricarboxylate transporter receptor subunit TctC